MNRNRDPSPVAATARREQFEALHAEHHAGVLGYVLRRTSSREDAADVVAETFLVAWRRLEEAQRVDTRPWLFGVARRVLANHRRGEHRRTRLADSLRAELARRQPSAEPNERFAGLAAAFRTLSDADREILALEAWEQLNPGEIAVVLGCSRNAARIRLHRARRRLRAATGGGGSSSAPAARARHPDAASRPETNEAPPETHADALARISRTPTDLAVTRGTTA